MFSGKAYRPDNYDTQLVKTERTGNSIFSAYKSSINGREAITWELDINVTPNDVTLTYSSNDKHVRGITTGSLPETKGWITYGIPTRYAEDYPSHIQSSNIFFNRKLKLWIAAEWDLDQSNSSRKDNILPNQTISSIFPNSNNAPPKGIACWAQDLLYESSSKTNNEHPLHEVLKISIANKLWSAIPTVSQKSSQFKNILKNKIYVDFWGGTFDEGLRLNRWMKTFAERLLSQITIIQNWQGGGFDSHSPLAISAELPINSKKGTEATLTSFIDSAKSWGMIGLRTNYLYYNNKIFPKIQTTRVAIDKNGKAKWHTDISDVLKVVDVQESYIKRRFSTTATFSDQLASSGYGFPYVDFNADSPHSGTIRSTRQALQTLARTIKRNNGGPLLSETLSSQYLLGEYIDGGEYGIFEGHYRALTPEYKLRRIQKLGIFFGAGLGYRFFYSPPYKEDTQKRGQTLYDTLYGPGNDDYRAVTILYGNAGYVFYNSALPRAAILAEFMTVGILQRNYLDQDVSTVEYYVNGKWENLESLLLNGFTQSQICDFIRVKYSNGFQVYVNRGRRPQKVYLPKFGEVSLPQYSYAAFSEDGKVEGFSGVPNGVSYRIDYTNDNTLGLQFVDPRGHNYMGTSIPTIKKNGRIIFDEPRYDKPVDDGAN